MKGIKKLETDYKIHEEYKMKCKINEDVVAIKRLRPIKGKKVEGSGDDAICVEGEPKKCSVV